MLKLTVNGKKEFAIEKNTINGVETQWDMIEVRDGVFHIIKDNKSYNAKLLSFNAEEKTMTINVNGNDYELSIKDKYDLILQQLGISAKSSSAVQAIKAPMPGLIISISVETGTEVKKGDPLLILEAMKMENLIKSPRDGKIKRIAVELRQPVDKGQVILEFE